jgi:DNA invertase Pin-like site-specific DNA recombinase
MGQRAAVYGRNSKSNAKSIDDQLDIGVETVGDQGWELIDPLYRDGSSASRHATRTRKDWPRLLADLDAGRIDVLVLWEASRGSREPIDWFGMLGTCRARGVKIHVVSDERTYDPRRARDWKDLATAGVDSAYETDRSSERLRRGARTAAIDGRPHGHTPYGYTRLYDQTTGKLSEQVPAEKSAPIVREIFTRLARRTPIITVVNDLNARGVPSPEGTLWNRRTLRRIATNPAYAGKRRHRTNHDGKAPTDETYEARWEALVAEDVFLSVQAVLSEPDRRTTKPGKAKYLLSYIATSPCGGTLRASPTRGHRAARYVCYVDECTSIDLADLDGAITLAMVGRLSRPDAADLFAPDDSAARAARAEAARLKIKVEEARRSFEQPDGISAEALARIERGMLPMIADAERRARPAGMSGVLAELIGASDVRAVWDGLSVAARRDVVATLATVSVGPASRRMDRRMGRDERMAEALARAGGSRWVGDDRTWAELARDA